MSPSKPRERLNLSSRTGIIIGGTSGIGLECAHVLLEHGLSKLIVSARDESKGKKTIGDLREVYPKAITESWSLDLVSYDSICSFVGQCATLDNIDFVILSSAMISTGFKFNPSTGHEEILQANYISAAWISLLLLPVLKAKRSNDRPAQLTLVGSGLIYAAKFQKIDAKPLLPALDDSTNWNMIACMERYVLTKLFLVMFMIKLQGYVNPQDVIINMADPGTVSNTGLDRHFPWPMRKMANLAKIFLGRTLNSAAWTYVDAAVVKGIESHGSYIMDWKIYP